MHNNKRFNSPGRPKTLNFYKPNIVTSKNKNT